MGTVSSFSPCFLSILVPRKINRLDSLSMSFCAWIRHVSLHWFPGLVFRNSSDSLKVACPCWKSHSLPYLKVPHSNKKHLSPTFSSVRSQTLYKLHFFCSSWNNQTLVTKLRLGTAVFPQPPPLTFPMQIFPLFHGLFFPTWETRRICIPGKVRREGEELWHRHIKRALCAQSTLFLESNQVPKNLTKLFRQHRNQSCRPLGLCFFKAL